MASAVSASSIARGRRKASGALAEPDNGTLMRVSSMNRWFVDDGALPADRVGHELRVPEVTVEAERYRVADLLRILPIRHQAMRSAGST